MRQYQVPQFITIEDKVIGNVLTIKQFLYLAGGAGIIALLRLALQPFLLVPLAIAIGAVAAALAFLKINDQPVPRVIKNMAFFALRPRLFVWKHAAPPKRAPLKDAIDKSQTPAIAIPKLSQSKLSDLAWSLDIKEKLRT